MYINNLNVHNPLNFEKIANINPLKHAHATFSKDFYWKQNFSNFIWRNCILHLKNGLFYLFSLQYVPTYKKKILKIK